MSGTLLLLPNLLSDSKYHEPYLPSSIDKAVKTLDGLIAESESAGRRFLGRFETKVDPRHIPIATFDGNEIDFLLEPLLKGERWGFVTDAGLPCVADPGAKLVARARRLGVSVQAFVGPSSIMLALMLSGMGGQRFSFHGYLPKDEKGRQQKLKELERRSLREEETEIWIEAPYRNGHMVQALLEVLSDETELGCVWELCSEGQGALVGSVGEWKRQPLPNLEKKRCVFLMSTPLQSPGR